MNEISGEIAACFTDRTRHIVGRSEALKMIQDRGTNGKIVGFACKDEAIQTELNALLDDTATKLYGL